MLFCTRSGGCRGLGLRCSRSRFPMSSSSVGPWRIDAGLSKKGACSFFASLKKKHAFSTVGTGGYSGFGTPVFLVTVPVAPLADRPRGVSHEKTIIAAGAVGGDAEGLSKVHGGAPGAAAATASGLVAAAFIAAFPCK